MLPASASLGFPPWRAVPEALNNPIGVTIHRRAKASYGCVQLAGWNTALQENVGWLLLLLQPNKETPKRLRLVLLPTRVSPLPEPPDPNPPLTTVASGYTQPLCLSRSASLLSQPLSFRPRDLVHSIVHTSPLFLDLLCLLHRTMAIKNPLNPPQPPVPPDPPPSSQVNLYVYASAVSILRHLTPTTSHLSPLSHLRKFRVYYVSLFSYYLSLEHLASVVWFAPTFIVLESRIAKITFTSYCSHVVQHSPTVLVLISMLVWELFLVEMCTHLDQILCVTTLPPSPYQPPIHSFFPPLTLCLVESLRISPLPLLLHNSILPGYSERAALGYELYLAQLLLPPPRKPVPHLCSPLPCPLAFSDKDATALVLYNHQPIKPLQNHHPSKSIQKQSQPHSSSVSTPAYTAPSSLAPPQARPCRLIPKSLAAKAIAIETAFCAALGVGFEHSYVLSYSPSLVKLLFLGKFVNELKSLLHDIHCLVESFPCIPFPFAKDLVFSFNILSMFGV